MARTKKELAKARRQRAQSAGPLALIRQWFGSRKRWSPTTREPSLKGLIADANNVEMFSVVEAGSVEAPVLTAPGVDLMRQVMGRRVRDARKDTGLNQTEFGKLVGKTQVAMAQLEGGRGFPPFPLLVTLSKISGHPISWFCGAFDDAAHDRAARLDDAARLLKELAAEARAK